MFAGYEKIFSKSQKNIIIFVQRTKKSVNIDGPASEL